MTSVQKRHCYSCVYLPVTRREKAFIATFVVQRVFTMTLYRKEFRLRKKVLEYAIIGIAIDRMDIAMLRKKFPIIFLKLKFCLQKLFFFAPI